MTRRLGLATAAVLLLAAGNGVVLRAATPGDGPNESPQIGADELARLPPIAFAWGPAFLVKSRGTGDLYIVRSDGSSLRRLRSWPKNTRGADYGMNNIRWSPDGRFIAGQLWINACDDPCSRVAVVAADGHTLYKRSRAGFASEFAWAPDGRSLVYWGSDDLRMTPATRGKSVRLWRAKHRVEEGVEWLPGGRSVVFASGGVVRLAVRSRKAVRLTRFDGDLEPVPSPNGRLVAFVRRRSCWYLDGCRDPANLYVVGVDGKGLRRLTRNTHASSPGWSPDGRSIAFGDSTGNVKVVRLGRAGVRSLTSDGDSTPVEWSPDGRKILVRRSETLWVMDADGGRPTRLPVHVPGWTIVTADWRG